MKWNEEELRKRRAAMYRDLWYLEAMRKNIW